MQQKPVAPSIEQATWPGYDVKTNLPMSLTPLLGREREQVEIYGLLHRPEVRLLTLTGVGGVGKTHLGLAVAAALLHDFPDGVFFVSLAPISHPALVMSTIAQTLGLRETADLSPSKQVQAYLREKDLLLVLDNFEQIVAAAPQLADLLTYCPGVHLLVTSRTALRIYGEYEFLVPPLAVPDLSHPWDRAALAQVATVHLFLQCAQAIQPTFTFTETSAQAIAEICVRLDGLPLAIILAAARIKLLPPPALLKRLSRRLEVLTGGSRDLPSRQQTLRNTLQWSYDLLNAEEQRLFRRLSVFVGGCTLDAANNIYHVGSDQEPDVLDLVSSLLDKSLLNQTEQEGEEPRFMMLETVREFGLERLAASREMEEVRYAYAQYFLSLAEEAAPYLKELQEAIWLQRLERDLDNFRAVMEWSLAFGRQTQNMEIALRLGTALGSFWILRAYLREAWAFMEQALAGSEGVAKVIRAKASYVAHIVTSYLGDSERAESLTEQSLALFRELDDTAYVAREIRNLGWVAHTRYNFARAHALYDESLALFKTLNDLKGIIDVTYNLAYLAQNEGMYEQARHLYEDLLTFHRARGNRDSVASTLFQLAQLLSLSSANPPFTEIQPLIDEGLALANELGVKRTVVSHQWMIAFLAFHRGDLLTARSILEEIIQFSREEGFEQRVSIYQMQLARINTVEGHYAVSRSQLEECIAIASKHNDVETLSDCLIAFAYLALAQKQYVRAVRLLGEDERVREAARVSIYPVERPNYERKVAAARAFLGEKTFTALWAEGHAMSLEEALATGYTNVNTQQAPPYPAGLTTREVEVLCLVAQGLTDAQVAEQLIVSPRTVTTHLTSIYTKLGISSRAAATRFAVEHHLV